MEGGHKIGRTDTDNLFFFSGFLDLSSPRGRRSVLDEVCEFENVLEIPSRRHFVYPTPKEIISLTGVRVVQKSRDRTISS